MYVASNRWFGMRIGLISAIFLAFVVYSAVSLADSEYTKLSQVLLYNILVNGMIYCTV